MSHIDFVQTKYIYFNDSNWNTILTAPFISTKKNQAVKLDAYLLTQWKSYQNLEVTVGIQYRLLRNGIPIYLSEPVIHSHLTYLNTINQRPVNLLYVDQPISGAFTYELQAKVTDSQYVRLELDIEILEASMSVLVVDNTTPASMPVYVSYEAQNGDGYVAAIHSQTDAILATIPVGKQPGSICISPDGSTVYVVNEGDHTVSIIDTNTNAVTATLNVGRNPKAVMVTPDNTKAYVANYDDKSITIINNSSKTVIKTVSVGSGSPFALAACPNSWYMYAACREGGTNDYVSAIAVDSDEVNPFAHGGWNLSFSTAHNPLVVGPDGHLVAALDINNQLRRINGPDDIGPGNSVTWLNQTVSGVYLNNGLFLATKSFNEDVIRTARNLAIDASGTVTADQKPDTPSYKGQNKIRVSPDQSRVCITITANDDQFAGLQVISIDSQSLDISSTFIRLPVANDLAITYDGTKAYVTEIEYVHPINLASSSSSESIHFGNSSRMKGIVGAYRTQS